MGACWLVTRLCPTLWQPYRTASHQAPLSTGFSKEEHWNASPFPSPGHLPDPEVEPWSSALAGGFFTTEPPGKPYIGASKSSL